MVNVERNDSGWEKGNRYEINVIFIHKKIWRFKNVSLSGCCLLCMRLWYSEANRQCRSETT
jgi:hypothetical protein